ncbi:MAG: 2-succinyl-5-enolpyruvyl-6-hydroxy-3-cyclohexene-1-carboxylic-acid synthase [Candidatus Endonucleobacter sp. (ex Gigantidas childressi)]|nr:2-succinyl-5-enolpyruvyl-6-hydroxy-3-cyclohexene-1-carboxylic-acid synthase [Candidatus Endonucleobacter sp. (ex Gigantidas childressi)]
MIFPVRHSNLNFLWSSIILEELWRLGVRECCIAPGSRSAPLTLAAATHKGLVKHIHFDERGLAFFALGLAKKSCRPVVVITTSGTAVANLYPAIIEARQSGVPLIVITADRPTELIDCGANQAIEQQGIYADYPGASLYFPPPEEKIPISWVLTSVDQAFARSCHLGLPMHINCMFRESLYPSFDMKDYTYLLACNSHWLRSGQPYTVYCYQTDNAVVEDHHFWKQVLVGKGMIVVGRIGANVSVEDVVGLADTLNWPIFADIQSNLHGHPAVIGYVDLLLASETGKQLTADLDQVLQIGGHFISKRLTDFLAQGNWKNYVMLSDECRRIDMGYRQTHHYVGAVDSICCSLKKLFIAEFKDDCNRVERHEKLLQLKGQSSCIWSLMATQFDDNKLTEGWVAANLGSLLPADCGLFIGNSLPVRLLDTFSNSPIRNVYTNRGASGIDGLVATASGCAMVSEKYFVAIIGDISFLHDLNSLALSRQVKSPFIIIVLNNDGGGIFNLLPLDNIAEEAEVYFQTPHGLNALNAAAMFGIDYHAPTCQSQFKEFLVEALNNKCCTVIEVNTTPGEAARQLGLAVQGVEGL